MWARSCGSGGDQLSDDLAKACGVPVDDDGGEEVQSCHSEVLSFSGAVAGLATTTECDGTLQRVMGFSFVQAELRATLHGIVTDLAQDEECALDPADGSVRGKLLEFQTGVS